MGCFPSVQFSLKRHFVTWLRDAVRVVFLCQNRSVTRDVFETCSQRRVIIQQNSQALRTSEVYLNSPQIIKAPFCFLIASNPVRVWKPPIASGFLSIAPPVNSCLSPTFLCSFSHKRKPKNESAMWNVATFTSGNSQSLQNMIVRTSSGGWTNNGFRFFQQCIDRQLLLQEKRGGATISRYILKPQVKLMTILQHYRHWESDTLNSEVH